jgi:hypothetical protein
MGCSFCRGHAHQVCGRPGCHDENEDLRAEERESMRLSNMWQRLPNLIACTKCGVKVATYYNGFGGYRCDTCPRDGSHE